MLDLCKFTSINFSKIHIALPYLAIFLVSSARSDEGAEADLAEISEKASEVNVIVSDSTQSSGSQAKALGFRRAPEFVEISFETRFDPLIKDYRIDSPSRQFSFGENPNPGSDFQLIQSDFKLRTLSLKNSDVLFYLLASLPIRNLKSLSKGSISNFAAAENISEIGGYSAGGRFDYRQWLSLSALYSKLQSSQLKLFSQFEKYSLQLELGNREDMRSDLAFSYALQIERGILKNTSPQTQYGDEWIAKLNLEFDRGVAGFSSLAIGALFTIVRIENFAHASASEGGAGCGAISPYLRYQLSSQIELNAKYHYSFFRPLNREYTFSNPNHPGLFGNSIQVGLALR